MIQFETKRYKGITHEGKMYSLVPLHDMDTARKTIKRLRKQKQDYKQRIVYYRRVLSKKIKSIDLLIERYSK